MKADKELIDYIKKLHAEADLRQEKYKPNTKDGHKHIFYFARSTAFEELLLMLDV